MKPAATKHFTKLATKHSTGSAALTDQGFSVNALVPINGLLSRCIEGDSSAWRDLHRWLHPKAAAFLRQMGVHVHDLDDVCQDVFVQVFRYLPRFQGRSELSTWLYKICLSQAARFHRRRSLAETLRQVLRRVLPAPETPAGGDWSGVEAQRHMETALRRMSERQRLVFVLYELHGLPGEEIARIAGCPHATVRGRLREAREVFGQTLDEISREEER